MASPGVREGGAGGCHTSLFALATPCVWKAFSSSHGLAELLLNLEGSAQAPLFAVIPDRQDLAAMHPAPHASLCPGFSLVTLFSCCW